MCAFLCHLTQYTHTYMHDTCTQHQVDPENESAKANKRAAGGWLEHRRKVQAAMDAEALERAKVILHARARPGMRARTRTLSHTLSLRQQPECRSMTGCQRRRGPSGFCLRMTRMKKMSCEHSGLVSVQRHHTIFFPFFFRQAVTTRCWQRSASLRGVGMGEGE
jgi:hypothetical protein